MFDELAPELLWISGLGTAIVFGLMMVVWFISTREGVTKKDVSAALPSNAATKPPRKKKPYGSPHKKKEDSQLNIGERTERDEPVPDPNPQVKQSKDDSSTQIEQVVKETHLSSTSPRTQRQTFGKTEGTKLKTPQPAKTSTKPTNTKVSSNQKELISEATPLPTIPKKQKTKAKESLSYTTGAVMPGSQIAEIVVNSPLSDEEVQLVMEKLLEKQDEEWEATNKSDNLKSLKKSNEELQTRCYEAEKSAQWHSSRLKELSAEMKQERSRSIAAEKGFQLKLSKQQEEIESMKRKIQQYKEESEAHKATDHVAKIKALTDSNQSYLQQLDQLAQQNSLLNNQVASQSKQIEELQGSLKKELRQHSKESKAMAETELKQLFEQEKKKLQAELLASTEELAKVKEQLNDSLESEIDMKKEIDSLTQQLHVQQSLLNEKLSNSDSKDKLDELSEENSRLLSDLEIMKQQIEQITEDHKKTLEQLHSDHSDELNKMKLQAKIDAETTVADLEVHKKQEMEYLQNENAELKANHQTLEKQLTTAQESLKHEQNSRQLLENEIDSLKSVSNGTNEEVVKLKEDSDTVDDSKHLEEIEELKREKTVMQQKIDDLKKKNETLRDSCWKARDELEAMKKEHSQELETCEQTYKKQMTELRETIVTEQQSLQKTLLQRLFPDLQVDTQDEMDSEMWLQYWEKSAKNRLQEMSTKVLEKEKKIEELKSELEEGSQLTDQLRDTLSGTLAKLEELMKKWEEKESDYMVTISNEQNLRSQAEEEIKRTNIELDKLKDELNDRDSTGQSLEEEKLKAKKDLEQVQVKMENLEKQLLEAQEEKEQLSEKSSDLENSLTNCQMKLKESEKLVESLRAGNQDLNIRLSKLSPPPPPIATSSEV